MSLGLNNVNFLIQPFNVAFDRTVSQIKDRIDDILFGFGEKRILNDSNRYEIRYFSQVFSFHLFPVRLTTTLTSAERAVSQWLWIIFNYENEINYDPEEVNNCWWMWARAARKLWHNYKLNESDFCSALRWSVDTIFSFININLAIFAVASYLFSFPEFNLPKLCFYSLAFAVSLSFRFCRRFAPFLRASRSHLI